MRRFAARHLLLALALALGQWLVLAHAFEHPAVQGDALCKICAHAQGLDGAALTPIVQPPVPAARIEAPAVVAVQPARAAARRAYDIRGPPAQAVPAA
ncbi:hypothetical protein [Solimonas soli]|uniref:hypothetical protein n=1 Tax=Solimonas soli TaxID=413479 RepID=UPI00048471A5|nr:hypothetical protein [Solimonas soli]